MGRPESSSGKSETPLTIGWWPKRPQQARRSPRPKLSLLYHCDLSAFYHPFIKHASVQLNGYLLTAQYVCIKPGKQDRYPCLVKQEITVRCVMKEGKPGVPWSEERHLLRNVFKFEKEEGERGHREQQIRILEGERERMDASQIPEIQCGRWMVPYRCLVRGFCGSPAQDCSLPQDGMPLWGGRVLSCSPGPLDLGASGVPVRRNYRADGEIRLRCHCLRP